MEPKADLRFPTQQELLFPLLEVLAENGPMQAKDACQAVAEKINLRPELRNVSVSYDDGRHHTNLFDRKTRWVRQNATIAQLIPKEPIGIWSLSEEGHRALTMARPSLMVRHIGFSMYASSPACITWMAIHARAWVVVSTITPSSFSLSIIRRKSA